MAAGEKEQELTRIDQRIAMPGFTPRLPCMHADPANQSRCETLTRNRLPRVGDAAYGIPMKAKADFMSPMSIRDPLILP